MSQLFQPVPFEGGIQHECYLGVRRPKEGNKKMVTISTQSDDPLSLQEGATFKDKSGKTLRKKGNYLTVWKKDAVGSWKVLFDSFNYE